MLAPKPDPTERVLIDGIRAGDVAAFEQVFQAYHQHLCDFANRYVCSPAVAEEIVHDLFCAIWASREQWQVRGNLRTYLFTATRNRAVSYVRHEVVERRWRERSDWGPAEAERHAENEGQHNLEAAERIGAVRRLLAELPERCRLALTLRWQREMSYAEIAEAMGISIKTVEIHLARGAKALRERYRELFPDR